MSRKSRNVLVPVLTMFLALAFAMILPESAQAQLSQIKPRIIIVFDTSGSMAYRMDTDATVRGDGSIDPWTSGRKCCPGTPEGNDSTFDQALWNDIYGTNATQTNRRARIWVAKEAMRKMVYTAGDIEYGLARFAQTYQETSNNDNGTQELYYYWRNQFTDTGGDDYSRYSASGTWGGTCNRNWLCVGFQQYGPGHGSYIPGSDPGEIAMWMDHHEFSWNTGAAANQPGNPALGKVDFAPNSAWGMPRNSGNCAQKDGLEQELRADGSTPLASAINKARDHLRNTIDAEYQRTDGDAYDSDSEYWHRASACRPYSVIMLTDGDANSGEDPETAINRLYTRYYTSGVSGQPYQSIDTWVIGLAGAVGITDLTRYANAGGGHTDQNSTPANQAYVADSEDSLSSILYQVVSGSVMYEICNSADDDCDGQTDEDGVRNRCEDARGVDWCNANPTNMEACCHEPPAETCNGEDDDCDGIIDNNIPGMGSECNATGGASSDPDEGICIPGTLVCEINPDNSNLELWCKSPQTPETETCDGLDNDCDGDIDEELGAPGIDPCAGNSSEGICVAGTPACEGGRWVCNDATLPESIETCDGEDDDCDGTTDEGVTRPCGGCDWSGCPGDGIRGRCFPGAQLCDPAMAGVAVDPDDWWFACEGGLGPDTEQCNNVDDDCDGPIDNGISWVGDACGGAPVAPWDTGACVPSTWECNTGVKECGTGAIGPVPEGPGTGNDTCDDVDNDCDGTTDENISTECGYCSTHSCQGACVSGTATCAVGDPGNIWTACVGNLDPTQEVCDGLDNDCDGDLDLADPDMLYPGQTIPSDPWDSDCGGSPNYPAVPRDEGICEPGTLECTAGGLVCTGGQGPVPENPACNGVDEDCDGLIDEGITTDCGGSTSYPSVPRDEGVCQAGFQYCPGSPQAIQYGEDCKGGSTGLTYELCNDLDDDCDGNTDNGTVQEVDDPCTVGLCPGTKACTDGNLECVTTEPILDEEICNGKDDDCNGEIDEGVTEVCGGCDAAAAATTDCEVAFPDRGICEQGIRICDAVASAAAGSAVWGPCLGDIGPGTEDCDGLDNDCDGFIDNNDPSMETDTIVGDECGGCDPSSPDWNCSGDRSQGECEGGNFYCLDNGLGSVEIYCCDGIGGGGVCNPTIGPKIEMCDTLDNDCDGLTDSDDNNSTPLTGVGGDCGGGPPGHENDGICNQGSWECNSIGETVCSADAVGPGDEGTLCNDADDDCDGDTDEGIITECGGCDGSDVGWDCTGNPNQGICAQGFEYCVNSDEGIADGQTCHGEIEPQDDEICNGVDDDCDGDVDKDDSGLVGIGGSCGVGACIGNMDCSAGGQLFCNYGDVPSSEECNNIDDNCNGSTDEGVTNGCGGCDGSNPLWSCTLNPEEGECRQGIQYCDSQSATELLPAWQECQGDVQPANEVCDGLDNDCDGETDEEGDMHLVGTECMKPVGECQYAELHCVDNGSGGKEMACCAAPFAACAIPAGPTPEVCDGLDNDCNGVTDEGLSLVCGGCDPAAFPDGEFECLQGPDEGECKTGMMHCDSAASAPGADVWTDCQGDEGPVEESCNLFDDDCDGETDENVLFEPAECSKSETEDPNEGICTPGTWICSDNGIAECEGGQGPMLEECNFIDDDCDGETDEELPGVGVSCGTNLGVCEPGLVQCVCDDADPAVCDMVCTGETVGSEEECDGLDNDCDGLTDEDLPLGAGCSNTDDGNPEGVCEDGFLECIDGDWECNGPEPSEEVCDGLDNDCDGATDEELAVDCPDGSICIQGECAAPCGGEMSCPAGQTCESIEGKDGKQYNVCITDVCTPGSANELPCVTNEFWCDEGYEPPCQCHLALQKCVGLCEDIICPEGKVCVPSDGTCQPILEDDCHSSGCPEGQKCKGSECVEDPCAAAECTETQYCNDEGECIESCIDMECDSACYDGECVDPCEGVNCESGKECQPETGDCETPGACDDIICKYYEVCVDGECIEDPCWNLECPNGLECVDGNCQTPEDTGSTDADSDIDTDTDVDTDTDTGPASSVDAGTSGGSGMDSLLVTGMGGCLCTATPGADTGGNGGLAAILLGLLLAAWRLGKRRQFTLAKIATIGIMTVALLGCQTEPFQFEEGDAGNSTSDVDVDGDADSDTDADTDTDTTDTDCQPGVPDNSCDNVDNDCDGETDEDVDKTKDVHNCGECDNDCTETFPHAFSKCEDGVCIMGDCANYYQDINKDPSDGCEYYCKPTSDTDICDGVDLQDPANPYVGEDNNCNGEIDEDVVFDTDPLNCGRCGNVCRFPHGVPKCVDGACAYDECEEGFVDINGDQADGCEYSCVPDGAEVCDGSDNDCDGEIDENADVSLAEFGAEGGTNCYTSSDDGCTGDPLVCKGECTVGTWYCEAAELRCKDQTGAAAEETCNNLDDNCDGQTDEESAIPLVGDDGAMCGYAIGVCHSGRERCAKTAAGGDNSEMCCIDVDADGVCNTCALWDAGGTICIEPLKTAYDQVFPELVEVCDGVDNDCDNLIDEDPVNQDQNMTGDVCYYGQTGPLDVPYVPTGDCAGSTGRWTCFYGDWVCEGEITPVHELCDGQDNDCDGNTDEDIIAECGGCDSVRYPGFDCTAGAEVGVCLQGIQICSGGDWGADVEGTFTAEACDSDVGPSSEQCNGLDDDCDGFTDEDMDGPTPADPAVGVSCNQEGECSSNTTICENTFVTCGNQYSPDDELCNDKDDDCDGMTDETIWFLCGGCDPILYPTLCAHGNYIEGRCRQGIASCEDGSEGACVGEVGPLLEADGVTVADDMCNGQDDDCDGTTDEDEPGGGPNSCGPCGDGTEVCQGGMLTCQNASQPSVEICDGLDNDCVGGIDDLINDSRTCGGGTGSDPNAGVCQEGTQTCSTLIPANPWSPCTNDRGPDPGGEVCDNQDNDCDGATDEGLFSVCGGCDGDPSDPYNTTCAAGAIAGECKQGVAACDSVASEAAGSPVWEACQGELPPAAEVCDGKDNNCDGDTDEGLSNMGPCGTGICSDSYYECVSGDVECQEVTPPLPAELCNSEDDDCDGMTDEALFEECGGCDPDETITMPQCSHGNRSEGICQAAIKACGDSCPPTFVAPEGITELAACQASGDPTNTCLCDGLDNNCDGVTDEDWENIGAICGPCDNGTMACIDGSMQCSGGSMPSAELCNGIDDNCNGDTDEGLFRECEGAPINNCGGSPCPAGTSQGLCSPGRQNCDPINSNPGVGNDRWLTCENYINPVQELCDGLDNDCDDDIDENDATGVALDPAYAFVCDRPCPGDMTPFCSTGLWDCDYECGTGPNTIQCNNTGQHGEPVTAQESHCDVYDNNCNAINDENFNLMTNAAHCGACEHDCTDDFVGLSHVQGDACQGGQCVVICDTGWTDSNPADTQQDCDYECTITNGGVEKSDCIDNDCDNEIDEGFLTTEVCDGSDNDCDGLTDEADPDLTVPLYACDFRGECAGVDTTAKCEDIGGGSYDWVCHYELLPGDLELEDIGGFWYPLSDERICDGKDGNCDGIADESFFDLTPPLMGACDNDEDGSCRAEGAVMCKATQDDLLPQDQNVICCDDPEDEWTCKSDGEVEIPAGFPRAQDECDGLDDNCNGSTDEGLVDNNQIDISEILANGATFKIFTYEASHPGATDTTQGTAATAACSLDGKLPWTMVTKREAEQACWKLNADQDYEENGWKICSAEQWQAACDMGLPSGGQPHTYPYGNASDDLYHPNDCHGLENSNYDQDDPIVTGLLETCVSTWADDGDQGSDQEKLYDLSGNVEEWTSSPRALGGSGNYETIYQVRGGSYNDIEQGLTCQFDFWAAAPDLTMKNLGFRCCQGPEPLPACPATACPEGMWCSGNSCIPCDNDAHCGPFCKECLSGAPCFDGDCAYCHSNDSCGTPDCDPCIGGTPYCEWTGDGADAHCVECRQDSHCGNGACVNNVCVECDDDGDCTNGICEANKCEYCSDVIDAANWTFGDSIGTCNNDSWSLPEDWEYGWDGGQNVCLIGTNLGGNYSQAQSVIQARSPAVDLHACATTNVRMYFRREYDIDVHETEDQWGSTTESCDRDWSDIQATGGAGWSTLTGGTINYDHSNRWCGTSGWAQRYVDVSSYMAAGFRVQFRFNSDSDGEVGQGINADEIYLVIQ